MAEKLKILIYGYGNPGRQDDGLGIRFVEALEKKPDLRSKFSLDFDSNYQLNIEDADRIKDKDLVIFADASYENIDDYYYTEVEGSDKPAFTTHAANPAYIVQLCRQLYDKEPQALLLHMKGYRWELEETLTEPAEAHLQEALKHTLDVLERSGDLSEITEGLLTRSN